MKPQAMHLCVSALCSFESSKPQQQLAQHPCPTEHQTSWSLKHSHSDHHLRIVQSSEERPADRIAAISRVGKCVSVPIPRQTVLHSSMSDAAGSQSPCKQQGASDAIGLALSAAVAAAGLVAYKLVIRLRWHREQLTVKSEQLNRVKQDLSSTASELLQTRSQLELKLKDLNLVIVQLEQTRGELGSRTSENQVMKQELYTAKRQLASMQQQLERTKMELRSSDLDDYWADARSP